MVPKLSFLSHDSEKDYYLFQKGFRNFSNINLGNFLSFKYQFSFDFIFFSLLSYRDDKNYCVLFMFLCYAIL